MKGLMTVLTSNKESLKVYDRDIIWSVLHFQKMIQAPVWETDWRTQENS